MFNETLASRLSIAYLLILIEMSSIIALDFTPRDDSYYLVCSLFNFAIICILPYISKTNLIVDFQHLNFIALIFQCFGFVSYWYELPVVIYNYAIHSISLLQLLRLLITRKGDADECNEDNYWGALVHYYHFYLFKTLLKKEKI